MSRKSFLIHIDSLDILDDLTKEQAGELFLAIRANHKNEDITLSPIVKIAFSPFKNQFIRDNEKYSETCKRRAEAGSKGGKQKVANASKCKQKVANVADSVNDSDSDSKNDSKNKSDSKKEKDVYKNIVGLDVPVFEKYLKYRKDAKIKKLTPQGEKLAANKLIGFGEQEAVVNQSISNGWSGLFAVKAGSKNTDDDFNELLAETNAIEGECNAG